MAIIPYRAVNVWQSERYLLVEALDDWGSLYMSEAGWCIVAQSNPAPTWLGENVRKAIETSHWPDPYHMARSDYNERFPVFREKSTNRRDSLWEKIVRDYNYKDEKTARRNTRLLFIEWLPTQGNYVKLTACKVVRGGHAAWTADKNEGKVLHVDINAPFGVFGLAVLDGLSRCE